MHEILMIMILQHSEAVRMTLFVNLGKMFFCVEQLRKNLCKIGTMIFIKSGQMM